MLNLDVIDAHHHLCRLSEASYPWLEGPPQPRYHGDDRPLRRDYLLPDYLADAAQIEPLGARLVGSVHVENGAADPLWEVGWVDRVIAAHGLPTVQVAKVDLTAADARDRLAEVASYASVRGVRDIVNWHVDPFYSHRDRPGLMRDPDWLAGFAALDGLGLSFDLQVFPGQLEEAAALAGDHADTAIVLDHAGMPIDRDPEALVAWQRDLATFAAQPNTAVKISALGTNDHRWTPDSIRRIVLAAIETFGPHRCMIASNFPVDGLYSTFGQLFSAFDELTKDLSAADRVQVFSGTAARFYRLDHRAEPSADGPAKRPDASTEVTKPATRSEIL